MEASDRIERTMTFHVPRELVWDAITQPESISKWFGDDTELELNPGGEAVFRWGEIEVRATVDAVEPPSRFSYRWEPSHTPSGGPTTLVEFTLEEIDGGTRLTLVESGFASLGAEARQENEYGWDDELSHLREHLGALVGA
jgi:uncharacterized protein YndB with AHSA1/START domain